MSYDLISRKALLKKLEVFNDRDHGNEHFLLGIESAKEIIKNEPAAFDKKKVIEELREELNLSDAEKERCARENILQFDSAKGYANGIANAIEIVEKGGIE